MDYIRRTGHNRPRLALYTCLLQAIEAEWWRRGKLNRNEEGYFDWPTTLAKLGAGALGDIEWVVEGLFSYLGYHAGKTKGLPAPERQAILRRVFSMQLPPIDTPTYSNAQLPFHGFHDHGVAVLEAQLSPHAGRYLKPPSPTQPAAFHAHL